MKFQKAHHRQEPRRVVRLAVAATAASLLAAGCGGGEPAAQPSATASASQPAPATSSATPAGPGEETATSRPTTGGTHAAIADGRWPAYVTAAGSRTLTMDLVEFLTGDRAIQEWQKHYPNSPDETPPNDYFILNDNPKLRTIPLASHVSVKVVNGGSTPTLEVGVAGLGAYLSDTLFWITVHHGRVVQLRQQFLP